MDYMVEGISEKDSKMNLAVTRLLEQEGIQRDGNLILEIRWPREAALEILSAVWRWIIAIKGEGF